RGADRQPAPAVRLVLLAQHGQAGALRVDAQRLVEARGGVQVHAVAVGVGDHYHAEGVRGRGGERAQREHRRGGVGGHRRGGGDAAGAGGHRRGRQGRRGGRPRGGRGRLRG